MPEAISFFICSTNDKGGFFALGIGYRSLMKASTVSARRLFKESSVPVRGEITTEKPLFP